MKPLSKKVRDLIGKPGAVPEGKEVAEQKKTELGPTKMLPVQPLATKPAAKDLKPVCQNCKHYSRQTKQCIGIAGQALKYVPRKGTCEAFDTVS